MGGNGGKWEIVTSTSWNSCDNVSTRKENGGKWGGNWGNGGNGGKWGEMGENGKLLQVHQGKCVTLFQPEMKMNENGGNGGDG